MSNQLVFPNGLIVSGGLVVTGSNYISGSITIDLAPETVGFIGTGSWSTYAVTASFLEGTSSWARTASYANTVKPAGVDTTIQYNANGVLAGNSNFTYNGSNVTLLADNLGLIVQSSFNTSHGVFINPNNVSTGVTSSGLLESDNNGIIAIYLQDPPYGYMYANGALSFVENSFTGNPASFLGKINVNTLTVTASNFIVSASSFIVSASSGTQFTGSVNLLNGATGSLFGTASYVTGSIFTGNNLALSASYSTFAYYPNITYQASQPANTPSSTAVNNIGTVTIVEPNTNIHVVLAGSIVTGTNAVYTVTLSCNPSLSGVTSHAVVINPNGNNRITPFTCQVQGLASSNTTLNLQVTSTAASCQNMSLVVTKIIAPANI